MNEQLAAFLASWDFHPVVAGGVALAGILYWWGRHRMKGQGRGLSAPPAWRAWCYGLGLAMLAFALLSPVATYSELFFFLHMTEHMLIIIVAAPLLLLGAPLLPTLWALPRGFRREVGLLFSRGHPVHRLCHQLTRPLPAILIYLVVVGGWHIPRFYDAAEGVTLTHDLEHLSFLIASLVYWWPVVHPTGGRRRLSYLASIPYLIPALVEGTIIGIVLTFARVPVYETYQRVPRVWGLSVMADQQLGGLIMWIVGGALYLVPILALFQLFLSRGDEPVRERRVAAGQGDWGRA